LGRQFDLDPVIASARILAERRVPARFVLCGSGERLDHYRARAVDLDNVLLPGWVDEARIHVLLRRSHAGIDPLPDRYDYLASINNKAIEYLSAGVPVISSPPRGVLAETLAKFDCGASCAAQDAGALADLVEYACANPEVWARKAANAKAFFERDLAAEKVYESFHRHLESIVESIGPSSEERNEASAG
jgi:2-deoxystreptamine N-acetyl-D-glucosaminyltransferase/2-deoxystreptamine glucosyltransferase